MLNGDIIIMTPFLRNALLGLGWIPAGVIECQNCKYWLKRYHVFDRGICKHRKVMGAEGHAEDGLDRHDLDAVTCGPKFGCVHFKEKEDHE